MIKRLEHLVTRRHMIVMGVSLLMLSAAWTGRDLGERLGAVIFG